MEGSVDINAGSGLVTSRVLVGHPNGTSDIGLPGLTRVIRVTAVETTGTQLRMRGVIEDRAQLRRGESHQVGIVVIREQGTLQAPFLGQQNTLKLRP